MMEYKNNLKKKEKVKERKVLVADGRVAMTRMMDHINK